MIRGSDVPAEMTYQQLGPSGLTVSTIGIGCNNFGARMPDHEVPSVVNTAIDAGITGEDRIHGRSIRDGEDVEATTVGE